MLDKVIENIGEGELQSAINALIDFVKHKSDVREIFYNDCTLIKERLSTIEKTRIQGILYNEDYFIEINKISVSLLELVQQIESGETGKSGNMVLHNDSNAVNRFRYDLFLSYSSKEQSEALLLFKKLSRKGVKTFFSGESLKDRYGQPFSEYISNALENSRHFLWFCTPSSLESKWVKVEWETFYQQFHLHNPNYRRFFLLKSKNLNMLGIPLLLRQLQISGDIDDFIQIIIKDKIIGEKQNEDMGMSHQKIDSSKTLHNKRKVISIFLGITTLLYFTPIGFVQMFENGV